MENALLETKNELIEWIENTFDPQILQKVMDLKNNVESLSLISNINSETPIETHFDEQFAAGMSSDELMENIASHIASIDSEKASTVSDPQSEYAVKDDFEERFSKGLTLEESKKRTFDFIDNLPWKK
jgi:hypothetical protein